MLVDPIMPLIQLFVVSWANLNWFNVKDHFVASIPRLGFCLSKVSGTDIFQNYVRSAIIVIRKR